MAKKLPLKALRAMADMTQDEVADAVGVTGETYRSWEKYRTYPNIPQLLKLAQVLNCGIDDIFFPLPVR